MSDHDSPPPLEDDTTPSDKRDAHPEGVPSAVPQRLNHSNSTASEKSVKSIRGIGNIPLGQLRLHDPDIMMRPITEETPAPVVPPHLLARGDIFRLLDFPPKFIVGHDMYAMTTSQSLEGFREIPAGLHFLWVQDTKSSPRCGCWYLTKLPGAMRIKQWDKFNEVLGDPASQYEVHLQLDNIETIYPSLKPYTLVERSDSVRRRRTLSGGGRPEPSFIGNCTSMWTTLTDAITASFLNRATGKGSVAEWHVDSMDCTKDESKVPGLHTTVSGAYRSILNSELQFLFSQDIQDLRVIDRSHPRLQFRSPDTTNRILARLKDSATCVLEHDVVAELQFVFITGTHLNNVACLEYWWKFVLRIILCAFRLALERPELCKWLICTLHAQLVYTENKVDPLEHDNKKDSDGPSGNRLLYQAFRNSKRLLQIGLAEYKSTISDLLLKQENITAEQMEVGEALNDLETWLWRCGWDLRISSVKRMPSDDEDDDDDDLPVVVETDANGYQVGLVSFDRD